MKDDDYFDGDFEDGRDDSCNRLNYRDTEVFKKAMEILDITRAITDTISEKKDIFDVRNMMISNAMAIGAKIAAAEGGDLFHIRMECACQIKISAKDLLSQTTLCEIDGLTDRRYLKLLRNLVEEFRQVYLDWVLAFDKANDIDDGWTTGK